MYQRCHFWQQLEISVPLHTCDNSTLFKAKRKFSGGSLHFRKKKSNDKLSKDENITEFSKYVNKIVPRNEDDNNNQFYNTFKSKIIRQKKEKK